MAIISTTPHLVVVRPTANDGTDLHEFWVLKSYCWEGGDPHDDPTLHVHIAPWSGTSDTKGNGLPRSEDRASDGCKWSEAPEEIREAFREQANELQQATVKFK